MDLNNSDDLLTFKYIDKILNKNLLEVNDFYEKTNKISNTYFTFGNYINNNKVLEFSKNLLEFMTMRFICYPYAILLEQIILKSEIEYDINIFLTIFIPDLYTSVSTKLVKNNVHIFNNQYDELNFSFESTKIILDDFVQLLEIEELKKIAEDDEGLNEEIKKNYIKKIDNLLKTIKEINLYFDTFVNKTILNWLVVIENVFKFDINQGRIVKSIINLQT